MKIIAYDAICFSYGVFICISPGILDNVKPTMENPFYIANQNAPLPISRKRRRKQKRPPFIFRTNRGSCTRCVRMCDECVRIRTPYCPHSGLSLSLSLLRKFQGNTSVTKPIAIQAQTSPRNPSTLNTCAPFVAHTKFKCRDFSSSSSNVMLVHVRP